MRFRNLRFNMSSNEVEELLLGRCHECRAARAGTLARDLGQRPWPETWGRVDGGDWCTDVLH